MKRRVVVASFLGLLIGIVWGGLAEAGDPVKSKPSWIFLQGTEPPTKTYPTLKVWGFVQAIYFADQTEGLAVDNTFAVRRARIGVRGSVTPNVDFFFLEESGLGLRGGQTVLTDASITLKANQYANLRVGQFKIPFGLEALEPVLVNPMIDFTRATERLLLRPDALNAANPATATIMAFRDIGAQFFGKIDGPVEFVYAAGVFNGSGINLTDNNSKKDVVLRGELAGRGARLGLSYWAGDETPANLSRQRYGVDLSYYRGPFELGFEYIYGKDEVAAKTGKTKGDGWYVRAGYVVIPKVQLVARYEQFDPNKDKGSDKYTATTLGVNYLFTPLTRLQLNYAFRDDKASPALDNLFIAQMQIVF